MDITVRHNRVYLRSIKLGEGFSNITADLICDKNSRVKVMPKNKLYFFIDLDRLPPKILHEVSEKLRQEAHGKILLKIQKKVDDVLTQMKN